MKPAKRYRFNGLAGCVQQRRARSTGTLVGVYHSEQSGLDRAIPWTVVCEAHSNCLGCETLRVAKIHATDPAGWCEDCRIE